MSEFVISAAGFNCYHLLGGSRVRPPAFPTAGQSQNGSVELSRNMPGVVFWYSGGKQQGGRLCFVN